MASLFKQQQLAYLKGKSYKADQVLDVGGGDTSIREYTSLECNRYLVLDNDPELKPAVIHDLNEFMHPDELFASERNPRFDLIFCFNVAEYIHNPYNMMANLYSWLAADGKLVMNFPFLYPLHNPEGIDYLRYTHEWVNKMFHEKFKFKEVNIQIIEATEGAADLAGFYNAEKMHRRKHDETWREIGCIVEAVR